MKLQCIHTGPFGINTWIVPFYKNYVFVVDPACCSLTEDRDVVIDYIKKNNYILCGILLTHGHFDHITGTGIMKEAYPKVSLAIHEEDELMIGSTAYNEQGETLSYMGLGVIASSLKDLPPSDVTFKGGETLDKILDLSGLNLNDSEVSTYLSKWEILHTPGHTPGSVCFYNMEEKTLISGDTLFYGSYGRTDLKGGNEALMVKSLKSLNKLPSDTLVYPAHDYYGFKLGDN